jgi:hypothetical protein
MKGKTASFRVGKVRAYRRAKVWYLQYYEGASGDAPGSGRTGIWPGRWPPRSTVNWRWGPRLP